MNAYLISNKMLPLAKPLARFGQEFQYKRVPRTNRQADKPSAIPMATVETAVWGG